MEGGGGGERGSGFLTHSVVVCFQFISEEEECFLGHSRGVLLASDGLALVILLTHGHDPSVVKMTDSSLSSSCA